MKRRHIRVFFAGVNEQVAHDLRGAHIAGDHVLFGSVDEAIKASGG